MNTVVNTGSNVRAMAHRMIKKPLTNGNGVAGQFLKTNGDGTTEWSEADVQAIDNSTIHDLYGGYPHIIPEASAIPAATVHSMYTSN